MRKIVIGILLISSLLYSYSMDYTKDTTCLVRHLKVYENPKWVAKVELKNGKEVFFSSPKSMFEFFHRPEDDFKNIIVTDFKTLLPVKAKGAFYIYGSNVTSPAGDDLVPFDSYKAAEIFAKEHNGKRILGFKEVSEALIKLLNGNI
jgi:copper chaperone NosL